MQTYCFSRLFYLNRYPIRFLVSQFKQTIRRSDSSTNSFVILGVYLENQQMIPAKLLIVEDYTEMSFLLSKTFSEQVEEVLVACNGAQELRVLDRHSVDLIISDIDLPEMDG